MNQKPKTKTKNQKQNLTNDKTKIITLLKKYIEIKSSKTTCHLLFAKQQSLSH